MRTEKSYKERQQLCGLSAWTLPAIGASVHLVIGKPVLHTSCPEHKRLLPSGVPTFILQRKLRGCHRFDVQLTKMKKELMSNAKVWPDMKQRSGAVSQNQREFQITADPLCLWTSGVSNLSSGESKSKMQPVSLGEKTSSSMPRLRLNRVIEFVDANITLDLCVSTLASVAGMSSFYFCRSFKQSTGITPHRYVLTRRMEHAKQLLQEKTVPLVQVAHEVGFADQSQFTRVFHKIVGTTPSQYRKVCRTADS